MKKKKRGQRAVRDNLGNNNTANVSQIWDLVSEIKQTFIIPFLSSIT